MNGIADKFKKNISNEDKTYIIIKLVLSSFFLAIVIFNYGEWSQVLPFLAIIAIPIVFIFFLSVLSENGFAIIMYYSSELIVCLTIFIVSFYIANNNSIGYEEIYCFFSKYPTLFWGGAASVIALIACWLVHFRIGNLLMCQPAIIVLARDGYFYGSDGDCFRGGENKIYLHAFFHSDATRGHVIEKIYAKLSNTNANAKEEQYFNILAHGLKKDLKQSSGFYVSTNGVAYDLHFLLENGSKYEFKEGENIIEIHAETINPKRDLLIKTITLYIDKKQAKDLESKYNGLFFDLKHDSLGYTSYIKRSF